MGDKIVVDGERCVAVSNADMGGYGVDNTVFMYVPMANRQQPESESKGNELDEFEEWS